ncbi:hypothetical protein [Lactococcus lactis]|uniref:hypothetical protein n=1 Tax=Lactococcus lactis TaxID=1358 RepID=UPI00289037EC|nr:hypothetical protein [Lactococcus lactis]MDT2897159.1 hypothetical protein [Lactococcus lactis]MDT2948220.1 hypothetical protein [Lactococcus lactis]MDT2969414.1 hypothetical protein [Lactococcus lactis]
MSNTQKNNLHANIVNSTYSKRTAPKSAKLYRTTSIDSDYISVNNAAIASSFYNFRKERAVKNVVRDIKQISHNLPMENRKALLTKAIKDIDTRY